MVKNRVSTLRALTCLAFEPAGNPNDGALEWGKETDFSRHEVGLGQKGWNL
jgi:hypothetical protein